MDPRCISCGDWAITPPLCTACRTQPRPPRDPRPIPGEVGAWELRPATGADGWEQCGPVEKRRCTCRVPWAALPHEEGCEKR